jgi:large subunit ribosomal protein L29
MKAADLREKSVEDLVELEKSLARDFFKARLKNFTNQLDDTSAVRKTKRDRARVLTLIRQKRGEASAASSTSATASSAHQPPAQPPAAAAPAKPATTEAAAPKKVKKAAAPKAAKKKDEAK